MEELAHCSSDAQAKRHEKQKSFKSETDTMNYKTPIKMEGTVNCQFAYPMFKNCSSHITVRKKRRVSDYSVKIFAEPVTIGTPLKLFVADEEIEDLVHCVKAGDAFSPKMKIIRKDTTSNPSKKRRLSMPAQSLSASNFDPKDLFSDSPETSNDLPKKYKPKRRSFILPRKNNTIQNDNRKKSKIPVFQPHFDRTSLVTQRVKFNGNKECTIQKPAMHSNLFQNNLKTKSVKISQSNLPNMFNYKKQMGNRTIPVLSNLNGIQNLESAMKLQEKHVSITSHLINVISNSSETVEDQTSSKKVNGSLELHPVHLQEIDISMGKTNSATIERVHAIDSEYKETDVNQTTERHDTIKKDCLKSSSILHLCEKHEKDDSISENSLNIGSDIDNMIADDFSTKVAERTLTATKCTLFNLKRDLCRLAKCENELPVKNFECSRQKPMEIIIDIQNEFDSDFDIESCLISPTLSTIDDAEEVVSMTAVVLSDGAENNQQTTLSTIDDVEEVVSMTVVLSEGLTTVTQPRLNGRKTRSRTKIRKNLPKLQVRHTPMGLPKPLRVKKEKFSLEEIYLNKNFKTPTEKKWETIFEFPKENKDGSVSNCEKRKKKRTCEFSSDPSQRKHKWKKNKVKSGKRKRPMLDGDLDRILSQKLFNLDNALKLADLSP